MVQAAPPLLSRPQSNDPFCLIVYGNETNRPWATARARLCHQYSGSDVVVVISTELRTEWQYVLGLTIWRTWPTVVFHLSPWLPTARPPLLHTWWTIFLVTWGVRCLQFTTLTEGPSPRNCLHMAALLGAEKLLFFPESNGLPFKAGRTCQRQPTVQRQRWLDQTSHSETDSWRSHCYQNAQQRWQCATASPRSAKWSCSCFWYVFYMSSSLPLLHTAMPTPCLNAFWHSDP